MQPNIVYTTPPNHSFLSDLVRSRRTLIAIGVIVVIVLGWVTWTHLLNKKTVTFQPTPGTTITVGTPSINNAGGSIYTVLARSTSEYSIRLKPGMYEVLYSGNDYISQYQPLNLRSNVVLTTPKLDYSLAKLDSLLMSSKASIHAALASSVNLSTYTPANEKLFSDGTWYAAQLVPADQINQDRTIVIAHHEKGAWKLVAGPKITLFIGDYPNIPQSIIRTINNLPYNP